MRAWQRKHRPCRRADLHVHTTNLSLADRPAKHLTQCITAGSALAALPLRLTALSAGTSSNVVSVPVWADIAKANIDSRGRRLTHRNALREGSNRFALSSDESVVITVMRSALGER